MQIPSHIVLARGYSILLTFVRLCFSSTLVSSCMYSMQKQLLQVAVSSIQPAKVAASAYCIISCLFLQCLHHMDVFGCHVHCAFCIFGSFKFANLLSNQTILGNEGKVDKTRTKRNRNGHHASRCRGRIFRMQCACPGCEYTRGTFYNCLPYTTVNSRLLHTQLLHKTRLLHKRGADGISMQ